MLSLGILNSNEEALVGQRISHFDVKVAIGAGGMGRVYLAQDIQLGRKVALKFLSESLMADAEAQERFLREARSASQLDHPNIGTIYETGEVEDLLFIAMAYYDGETLRDRLKRGAVPLLEALTILRQTCAGLAAAHAAGIIHRDVKPGNIMITRTGQVKILDFGLAKPAQRKSELDTGLTLTGATIGTVAYMSPEQAKGTPVDERTDIWSLGVVAYELLSGRRPFAAQETVAMLSRILTEPPPPIERPDLPRALVELVEEMLRKDRDERISSIAEVERHLARIEIGEEPTIIDPADDHLPDSAGSRQPTPAPPPRRITIPPWAWLAAVGIALSLSIIYLMNQVDTSSATSAEPTAVVVADFVNSTGNEALGRTLQPALSSALEAPGAIAVLPPAAMRETLTRMERLPGEVVTRRLGLEICERRGLPVLITGGIASLGANYVLTLDAIECTSGESVTARQVEVLSEEAVLDRLTETAEELSRSLSFSLSGVERFDGPLEPVTTDSLQALRSFSAGVDFLDTEGPGAAIASFERALELDADFASAEAWLGNTHHSIGRQREARDHLVRGFDLREEVGETERFFVESAYYDVVVGDRRKAMELSQQWARTFPDDPTPHDQMAARYRTLGQYERSLAQALEATELAPSDGNALRNLVRTQIASGRVDEARQTVDTMEAGQLGSRLVPGLRAGIAMASGDSEAARDHLSAYAGELAEGPETATLAWYLAGRGLLTEARATMEDALGTCQSDGNLSCLGYGTLGLAEALIDLGLPEEGETLVTDFVASLSISESGAQRHDAARAAILLMRLGRHQEAESLLEIARQTWPRDTTLQEIQGPVCEAILALDRGDAAAALEALEIARPYAAPIVLRTRGETYLELERPQQAVEEFEALASLAPVEEGPHYQPLSRLWLARAHRANGDDASAQRFLEEFLDMMSDADTGIPLLETALDGLQEEGGSGG